MPSTLIAAPTTRTRRCPIATVARPPGSTTNPGVRFAEAYLAEDAVLRAARDLAAEIGVPAVSPGAGAAVRLLAAACGARAVVEIGTGAGVSGLWLLRGMRPDGVLTTIDTEPEHQRIARRLFAAAGFPPGRTRVITGRALDVLPRLADRAYDLVFADADPAECQAYVDVARRLLRPGGILVVHEALAGGRIADLAAHDPGTVATREVVKAVRESDDWIPALLPAGGGLLAAVRRG
jgi:predicted O-methyltransferase YrrM